VKRGEVSSARWRLDSITIRGFRGVAHEQTVRFGGQSALLKGNNGAGKSTVALALQWTLFGRFPEHVLQNMSPDRFLLPVSSAAKGKTLSSCEVVFSRSGERLVMTRDGKSFSLTHGKERLADALAETRRDQLLGLDMDTLVRAVLLQQSRVRGLLLDELKERNRALDRLLGMDAIEELLEVIKTKPASDASSAWRQVVEAERLQLAAQADLLGRQLEEAERRARSAGFLNKDLHFVGLTARYAQLGDDLEKLAREHGVSVDRLPPCDSAAKAEAVSRAFAKALQSIRVGSDRQKRLHAAQNEIAKLEGLQGRWTTAMAARDEAGDQRAKLGAEHGSREKVLERIAAAERRVADEREALRAASSLRQLLADALTHVEGRSTTQCPVCEQTTRNLEAGLRKRIDSMSSETIRAMEAACKSSEQDVSSLKDVARRSADAEKLAATQQAALDKLRQEIAGVLGGAGIAESKVHARLAEKIEASSKTVRELSEGVAAMEQALEGLLDRERSVRDGLVPVLVRREEVAAFEARKKKAEALHGESLARAEEMAQLAAQLDRLRSALLEAKEELASESLGKAGPRAQQLYRQLVKQPLFDTLDIRTIPRAKKVDYAFEVSHGGSSATAREARLVLSDGQLTATAMALFFGLAESTQHDLDMLYVDDPTQNLDLRTKEAMAKVVTEMATRRQIILATQDEDFASFLEACGFAQSAVVHHFTDWNRDPSLRSTMPSATQ
jgi:DNA repair exonuclease SbcCD ATPase subunit